MKSLLSCLILVLVIVAGGWLFLNLQIEKSNENPFGTKDFVIEEGQGVDTISQELEKQGFLSQPLLFEMYVTFKSLRPKFRPGEYQLSTDMSIKELVRELTKDKPIRKEVKLVILEGWTNQEIADYVASFDLFTAEDFLSYVDNYSGTDYEFLVDKPSNTSLEGYLYPDTYLVYEDATPADLVDKMLSNFDRKLTNELRQEINIQDKSIFEILTLASIVEAEMYGYENRQVVADIFWSRLGDNYPLQSDATVNYITKSGRTRSTFDDLEIDNPYNTYKNVGLPPGPIGNPSIEAIKATIYPADTDYYFFLTTPDNEIKFSRTHEEHIANRNKYLQ